jgi:WD40 repeat protein
VLYQIIVEYLDKTLRVWDVTMGECLTVLEGHGCGEVDQPRIKHFSLKILVNEISR